jgi:transcriptional adapter 2-alpha
MEIIDEDDPEEMEFKNLVMDLYNHRLDERIKRKSLLIDYKILLDQHKRKRSKDEKEIINTLKIFARFTQSPEHYERLLTLFFKEKQLREILN